MRDAVTLAAAVDPEIAPGDASRAAGLRVGGFVPFTTTDFPGKLAAVVFCQGCPWRCRYCHNPHLIAADASAGTGAIRWSAVLDFLDRRRGLLDGVVFSGGEPTAQPGLRTAMLEVRARGFAVALHTAGAYPRRLASVLPLLDWIGLDVKAPPEHYEAITGVAGSDASAWASLDLVHASGVACEIRTTVQAVLTPPAALEEMGRALAARNVRRWVLQRFRAVGCADPTLRESSGLVDAALLGRLRAHVPEIVVR